MNIEDNASNDLPDDAPSPDAGSDVSRAKPLGYWLRTVDALLSREFATAFESTGAGRRDWMILNMLSGEVEAPGFAARLARKGKRLQGLADRGWVEQLGDGTWTLTDEGGAAQARLGEVVDGIRSRVSGAVSAEDYAITMASLEAMARELGWDENAPKVWRGFRPGFGPRGGGGGRGGFPGRAGFGPWARGGRPDPVDGEIRDGSGRNRHHGFRPGFGPGGPGVTGTPEDGFDPSASNTTCGHAQGPGEHGFGERGFGERGFGAHGHRDGHREDGRGRGGFRPGRGGQGAERAFERGFDAGFTRGRGEATGQGGSPASDAA